MRTISSIEELNIPLKHQEHILKFIDNVADVPFINIISRVILFGSCAREEVTPYSDIDIFITTTRDMDLQDEFFLMDDCLPPYVVGEYVSTDILVQPESIFNAHINSFGTVQKQVNKYGVDLSGLLRKRTRA